MDGDGRGFGSRRRLGSVWALSGVVVLLSAVQAGGASGGLDAVRSLPSLFGSVTATGAGVASLLVAGLLVVGWVAQGVVLFALDRDRHGALLGLATGGLILVVGAWNLSAAVGVGGIVPVLEGVGTALLALLGTVAVGASAGGYLDRSIGSDSERDTSTGGSGDASTDRSQGGVADATLDRLEDVAPRAIERAREASTGTADTQADVQESALREALAAAIDRGELTPEITSRYGESYEIVNLPTRFREFQLPPSDEPVHVRNLSGAMRDRVADERTSLAEVASMIEGVEQQYDEMERFVGRREESFDDRLQDVQSTLDSVAELCERLEGSFGERTREFVLEGRHPTVDGVTHIRSRLDDARERLHECAFDEAIRTLESLQEQSDELLTAVDFLVGLAGTVDAGARGASVPNETAESLLEELGPVLEEAHGRSVSIADGRVRLGPEQSSAVDDGASHDEAESTDARPGGSSTRDVERTDPAAISDEILFVFRDLATAADDAAGRVEYQTDQLPDAVRRSDVLAELVAFCRRQTDVVERVHLQEGAPPGFLELEFAGRTAASAITELRERFTSQYGDG